MSRLAIGFLLVSVALAAVAGEGVRAATPVDVGRLGLIMGTHSTPVDTRLNDGLRDSPPGWWRLVGGKRLADGRLALRIAFRPPPIELALEPGPAVLFANLTMVGDAGGDVGREVPSGPISATSVAGCPDPRPCVSHARVVLPADMLAASAARTEATDWYGVDVGLSLVRTFAGGTWIQVLPFGARTAGNPGTVDRPGQAHGRIDSYGAFLVEQARWELGGTRGRPYRGYPFLAIAEKARRSMGDDSGPLRTVPVTLEISLRDCSSGFEALTLHDRLLDRAFDAIVTGSQGFARQIALPVGVDWWFTIHGDNFWVPDETFLTVGPIRSDGDALLVTGSFRCGLEPEGEVGVTVITPGDPVRTDRQAACAAADPEGRGARALGRVICPY